MVANTTYNLGLWVVVQYSTVGIRSYCTDGLTVSEIHHATNRPPRQHWSRRLRHGLFFHPNNDKWRLTGVIVTGKVTRPVRLKQQLCYDGTQFYIVERNFKIESPPPTPFMSEEPQAAAVPTAYGARP